MGVDKAGEHRGGNSEMNFYIEVEYTEKGVVKSKTTGDFSAVMDFVLRLCGYGDLSRIVVEKVSDE